MVIGAGAGGGIGGGIGSAIGGIAGLMMDGGVPREYEEVARLWEQLQDPEFDMRTLTAPQLQMVGQIAPEVYDAVLVDGAVLPEDSPLMRRAQTQGLSQMQEISRDGLPLSDRLAADKAQGAITQGFSRAQGAVSQDLRERGRMGAGGELRNRLLAGQNTGELAARMGRDLTADSINNRRSAILASAGMGGQIRGQDNAISGSRASAANRFNEQIMNYQTNSARYAADARARANAYNVGTRQRVADTNTMSTYEAQRSNLNRQNQLRQQSFGNDVTKLTGQSNALMARAGAELAHDSAQQQNVQALGQGIGQAAGGIAGGFG